MSTRVVTLGTTSKVICPGLRVGWAVAPAAIGRGVGILKQAVDLQTTTLTQRIAHHVLTQPGFLASHVQGLQVRYQQQSAALATALRAELGDRLSFSEPDGGMFLWGRVRGVDTSELLASALENGVAFVPGGAFGVEAKHRDALRLSFATSTCEELVEGARRLTSTLLGWTSATVSGSRVSAT
jgi:2-aminoadipate transaminase